jgi:ubiquinone/menaquinone biosynthesis C-methylase UbiE
MEFKSDYINPYNTRFERVKFAVKQLIPFGIDDKRVLNIGGGGSRHLQRSLSELDSNSSSFEVDMTGDNDLSLNLDKIDKLPFEDQDFDFCLLTDILEHLENFHLILYECFRVTKKAIVISLPVPSSEFLSIIYNRRFSSDGLTAGIYSKFYGLPFQVPEDRHRWWFTYDDVISFFENFENHNDCQISIFSDLPQTNGIQNKLIKFFLPKRIYRNLIYNAIWIVIKK